MKILDVDLVLFCDEANGEYGVTHKETVDSGFNAFWNGIGIFHDVFEHWFEFNHKYFMGEYAMNICGEMVAMGKAMYYYEIIGDVRQLSKSIYNSFSDSIRITTYSEVQEAIQIGYSNFGDKLLSKIPYQKPVDNGDLEYQIEKFYNEAKQLKYDDDESCEYRKEFSKQFKDSITFQNIANPHRYGYRLAKRMIPHNGYNFDKLCNFIEYFNKFCKNTPAKELYNEGYSSLKVKVFKENSKIQCKAYLRNIEGKMENVYQ